MWPALVKLERLQNSPSDPIYGSTEFRSPYLLKLSALLSFERFRVYHIKSQPVVYNINTLIKRMQVLPVFTSVETTSPLESMRMKHSTVQEIQGVGSALYTKMNALTNPDLKLSMKRFDDTQPMFAHIDLRQVLSFSSAANAFVAAYQVFLTTWPLCEKICRAPQLFSASPETTLFGERVATGDGGFFDNSGIVGLLHATPDAQHLDVLYITREDANFENLKSLPFIEFKIAAPMEKSFKRKLSGYTRTDPRKSVAYAKLEAKVARPNGYGIRLGRTMTLHVISVHNPDLGIVPVIRKRHVENGRYMTYMRSILFYIIQKNLHKSLPNELYVAIGGGGIVTMCAGAPVLHFLKRMKKTIVLGSGISGGSWAFAFASYLDPGSLHETLPKQAAAEIVQELQDRLHLMYDGIEGTVEEKVIEMSGLPAFFYTSARYDCNWSRYIHDCFHQPMNHPAICPFVVSWCIMARAWQAP